MNDLSKVMKFLVALSLGVGLAWSANALAAEPKAAPAPAKKAPAAKPEAPKAEAPKAAAPRVIEIKVTDEGYVPSPIKLKKDEPVVLAVTRTTEETCALDLVMPDYGISTPLPLNKRVEIPFTPKKTGTVKYGCAMDQMISSVLVIE